jgi:hypothetical protein
VQSLHGAMLTLPLQPIGFVPGCLYTTVLLLYKQHNLCLKGSDPLFLSDGNPALSTQLACVTHCHCQATSLLNKQYGSR